MEDCEEQVVTTELGYPEWTSCMYLLIQKKLQHVVIPLLSDR